MEEVLKTFEEIFFYFTHLFEEKYEDYEIDMELIFLNSSDGYVNVTIEKYNPKRKNTVTKSMWEINFASYDIEAMNKWGETQENFTKLNNGSDAIILSLNHMKKYYDDILKDCGVTGLISDFEYEGLFDGDGLPYL